MKLNLINHLFKKVYEYIKIIVIKFLIIII